METPQDSPQVPIPEDEISEESLRKTLEKVKGIREKMKRQRSSKRASKSRKRLIRLTSKHNEAVELYAKQECRRFSEELALHQKLPRELRDLIYMHLVGECYRFSEQSMQDSELMDLKFVGPHMAYEVAEMHYRQHWIKLDHDRLKLFLTQGQFNNGVRPADHISKLEVTIRFGNLGSPLLMNHRSFYDGLSPAEEIDMYKKLRDNFSSLLFLPKQNSLRLEVEIHTVLSNRNELLSHMRFYNILMAIRDSMYDLSHAGVKFNLCHFNEIEENVRNLAAPAEACARFDRRNIFFLSKEECEEERARVAEASDLDDYFEWADLQEDNGKIDGSALYEQFEDLWGLKKEDILDFAYNERSGEENGNDGEDEEDEDDEPNADAEESNDDPDEDEEPEDDPYAYVETGSQHFDLDEDGPVLDGRVPPPSADEALRAIATLRQYFSDDNVNERRFMDILKYARGRVHTRDWAPGAGNM